MKKNKNWLVLILGLVLLLGLGQAAQAVLVDLGPPDPNTTSEGEHHQEFLGIRSGIRTATTCAWNFVSPTPRR